MKKEEQFQSALLKRLDVLIALALERADEGSPLTTGKIQRLARFGLTPSEIGDILGKEPNYVSAVMGKIKKRLEKNATKGPMRNA